MSFRPLDSADRTPGNVAICRIELLEEKNERLSPSLKSSTLYPALLPAYARAKDEQDPCVKSPPLRFATISSEERLSLAGSICL